MPILLQILGERTSWKLRRPSFLLKVSESVGFAANLVTYFGPQTHEQWNMILGYVRIHTNMTNNGGLRTVAAACMKQEAGFQAVLGK